MIKIAFTIYRTVERWAVYASSLVRCCVRLSGTLQHISCKVLRGLSKDCIVCTVLHSSSIFCLLPYQNFLFVFYCSIVHRHCFPRYISYSTIIFDQTVSRVFSSYLVLPPFPSKKQGSRYLRRRVPLALASIIAYSTSLGATPKSIGLITGEGMEAPSSVPLSLSSSTAIQPQAIEKSQLWFGSFW